MCVPNVQIISLLGSYPMPHPVGSDGPSGLDVQQAWRGWHEGAVADLDRARRSTSSPPLPAELALLRVLTGSPQPAQLKQTCVAGRCWCSGRGPGAAACVPFCCRGCCHLWRHRDWRCCLSYCSAFPLLLVLLFGAAAVPIVVFGAFGISWAVSSVFRRGGWLHAFEAGTLRFVFFFHPCSRCREAWYHHVCIHVLFELAGSSLRRRQLASLVEKCMTSAAGVHALRTTCIDG
jgi:hypothetical protein